MKTYQKTALDRPTEAFGLAVPRTLSDSGQPPTLVTNQQGTGPGERVARAGGVAVDERLLRAFVAVARHGSFSMAAEHLGYSQPAVTHQVRLLERLLGVALFDRAVIPAQLTDEGQMRLLTVEAVLALMDGLRGRNWAPPPERPPPIRIPNAPLTSHLRA